MAYINKFTLVILRGNDNPFCYYIHRKRYDKQVNFIMFNGYSNSRAYLQRYHSEFISFEDNDDFIAKLFPQLTFRSILMIYKFS